MKKYHFEGIEDMKTTFSNILNEVLHSAPWASTTAAAAAAAELFSAVIEKAAYKKCRKRNNTAAEKAHNRIMKEGDSKEILLQNDDENFSVIKLLKSNIAKKKIAILAGDYAKAALDIAERDNPAKIPRYDISSNSTLIITEENIIPCSESFAMRALKTLLDRIAKADKEAGLKKPSGQFIFIQNMIFSLKGDCGKKYKDIEIDNILTAMKNCIACAKKYHVAAVQARDKYEKLHYYMRERGYKKAVSILKKEYLDTAYKAKFMLFSDSYDLVQTAAATLWQYQGLSLNTTIGVTRNGNENTPRKECYRAIGAAVRDVKSAPAPVQDNDRLIANVYKDEGRAYKQERYFAMQERNIDTLLGNNLTVKEKDVFSAYLYEELPKYAIERLNMHKSTYYTLKRRAIEKLRKSADIIKILPKYPRTARAVESIAKAVKEKEDFDKIKNLIKNML